jgi:hypothetical protein
MAPKNRTARTRRPSYGWRLTVSSTHGSIRFISATTCRQPLCEAVGAVSGHFIFVCKPSSHPLIQEYVTGTDVELATHEETLKQGKRKSTYRYRWIHDIALRDGKDALKVNWFEIEIHNANNEVTYRNSFITDLKIGPANVAALAACGRARWKSKTRRSTS